MREESAYAIVKYTYITISNIAREFLFTSCVHVNSLRIFYVCHVERGYSPCIAYITVSELSLFY